MRIIRRTRLRPGLLTEIALVVAAMRGLDRRFVKVRTVAAQLDWDDRMACRVMRRCVAFGLIDRDEGHWSLTELGRTWAPGDRLTVRAPPSPRRGTFLQKPDRRRFHGERRVINK
jgi:hypothetical protein